MNKEMDLLFRSFDKALENIYHIKKGTISDVALNHKGIKKIKIRAMLEDKYSTYKLNPYRETYLNKCEVVKHYVEKETLYIVYRK